MPLYLSISRFSVCNDIVRKWNDDVGGRGGDGWWKQPTIPTVAEPVPSKLFTRCFLSACHCVRIITTKRFPKSSHLLINYNLAIALYHTTHSNTHTKLTRALCLSLLTANCSFYALLTIVSSSTAVGLVDSFIYRHGKGSSNRRAIDKERKWRLPVPKECE